MTRAATVLLCAALLVACGEESAREALKPWSRAVESDCRRVAGDLADVPRPPVTLAELAGTAPAAADLVDRAVKAIERRKVPVEGRPLARPFLRELERVRRRARTVADEARFADADRTDRAIKKLSDALPALERSAARAGVKACADRARTTALLDAARGPVFIEVLTRVTRSAHREAGRALREAGRAGVRAQADALSDAFFAIEDAQTRLSGLDNPTWAEEASDEYLDHLDTIALSFAELSDTLDSVVVGALTMREVQGALRRDARQLQRAVEAETRAARRLDRLLRERLLGGGEGSIGTLS